MLTHPLAQRIEHCSTRNQVPYSLNLGDGRISQIAADVDDSALDEVALEGAGAMA